MEPLIVNNQKRKKRKTRRNLDAIRKKARQISLDTDINKSCNPVMKTNTKFLAPKSSICITNQRLTLFRKAVSSDTVSRKKISETKHKKHNKENKNSNILEIQTHPQEKNTLTKKWIYNQGPNCVSYDNKSNNEIDIDKTPNSVILFSPSLHSTTGDSDTLEKLEINRSENVVNDMSFEDNVQSENNFYNNFMNEIPNYLQQSASILLKTDIVDKCKNSLRSLYNETHPHFENEDIYASNCDSPGSDPDDIMQNPIDYISHSYEKVSNPNPVSSPLVSLSSCSTMQPSSSPLSIIMSDSPEYIYYPHRLNQ